jgi:hypothetical protein
VFQVFEGNAFQFHYPEGWTLEQALTPEGLSITVQSPYSMFVLLNFYEKPVSPRELADEALASMSEEYPELDSERVSERLAAEPATGYDVSFFSLDLTNTCWIRAFSFDSHALLVFAQTSDLDLDRAELAFRGICASLKLVKSSSA